jgi:hypothetical protein
MHDVRTLLVPTECALLLVDQQAGLAFGVESIDRQTLVNNVVALARTASVFDLPVIVSTSASRVYSGPLMPAIQAALPGLQSIERHNMNLWGVRVSDGGMRFVPRSFRAGGGLPGLRCRRYLRRIDARESRTCFTQAGGIRGDSDILDSGLVGASARLDKA